MYVTVYLNSGLIQVHSKVSQVVTVIDEYMLDLELNEGASCLYLNMDAVAAYRCEPDEEPQSTLPTFERQPDLTEEELILVDNNNSWRGEDAHAYNEWRAKLNLSDSPTLWYAFKAGLEQGRWTLPATPTTTPTYNYTPTPSEEEIEAALKDWWNTARFYGDSSPKDTWKAAVQWVLSLAPPNPTPPNPVLLPDNHQIGLAFDGWRRNNTSWGQFDQHTEPMLDAWRAAIAWFIRYCDVKGIK